MGEVKDWITMMLEKDEAFMDFDHMLFYAAKGPVRSIKGLFINFKPEDKKLIEQHSAELLDYMAKKGKLTKEDLLEFKKQNDKANK